MKILIVVAASVMSAVLVLPTVSHAQTGSIPEQASELGDCHSGSFGRQA